MIQLARPQVFRERFLICADKLNLRCRSPIWVMEPNRLAVVRRAFTVSKHKGNPLNELHHEFQLRRDFLPRADEDEWPGAEPAALPVDSPPDLQKPLPPRPLVVDLDGTLVRSDLLIETIFSELSRRPHSIVDFIRSLSAGKACLKHRLSQPADFDPAILPYDAEVLKVIKAAREEGRSVYLASATHERLVCAVADHLGLFTGWFATNGTMNCVAEVKAAELVAAFGEGGFDYIGNDPADLSLAPRRKIICDKDIGGSCARAFAPMRQRRAS